jgi:hypothetical protein
VANVGDVCGTRSVLFTAAEGRECKRKLFVVCWKLNVFVKLDDRGGGRRDGALWNVQRPEIGSVHNSCARKRRFFVFFFGFVFVLSKSLVLKPTWFT